MKYVEADIFQYIKVTSTIANQVLAEQRAKAIEVARVKTIKTADVNRISCTIFPKKVLLNISAQIKPI